MSLEDEVLKELNRSTPTPERRMSSPQILYIFGRLDAQMEEILRRIERNDKEHLVSDQKLENRFKQIDIRLRAVEQVQNRMLGWAAGIGLLSGGGSTAVLHFLTTSGGG